MLLGWRMGMGFLILKPWVCVALYSIVVTGLLKIVRIASFWFLLCRKDRVTRVWNMEMTILRITSGYLEFFRALCCTLRVTPTAYCQDAFALCRLLCFWELLEMPPEYVLQKHLICALDSLVFQPALYSLRRALSKGLRLWEGEDYRFGDISTRAPWLHSC